MAVVAVQAAVAAIPHSPLQQPIPVAMAALAAICALRTLQCAASAGRALRWRWIVAALGFVAWGLLWVVNGLRDPALIEAAHWSFALVDLYRLLFVLVLLPPAAARERPALVWLDAAAAGVFVTLLAIFSWPGIPLETYSELQKPILYAGFTAMIVLAAVSIAAQPSAELKRLALAILAAQLIYAVCSAVVVEFQPSSGLAHTSMAWSFIQVCFIAYLALMAPVSGADHQAVEPGRHGALVHRLTPLMVAGLSLCLAFTLFARLPVLSGAAALAALAIYAARTTLLEATYRARQEAALETQTLRSQALLDMMHEVRSPLGAISLSVDFLASRIGGDGPASESLTAIKGGCQSIKSLLDTILDLERLDASLVKVSPEAFDLGAAMRIRNRLEAARAASYGIRLLCAEERFDVVSDLVIVTRVTANLLDNAMRFTETGGAVTVTLARPRPRMVCICIRNDGPPIPEAVRRTLFRRFGDVAKPLHGRRGSGLGLSICAALARLVEGRIELEPVPGGTEARFTFRESDPPRAAPAP